MLIYKFLSIFLYALAIPVFLISAFILILFSFISLPLFYKADKFFCRLILFSFGVRAKINGSFPLEGTYIIMMNHSSFLDVFLFPLVPKNFYSGITAKENFKYPIFSYLIKRINAIPIDRANTQKAIKSIEKAQEVINSGVHIAILPEGSRTLNGKMLSLKKGGFHMAMNTGASILPVGINGAFKCKPKNRWWIIPGIVTINIGKPITSDFYKSMKINELLIVVENKLKILSGEKII